MSKRKFVKPLIIGCACLVPVGLVVGLSVNWKHIKTISCIGSGGAKPFVEAFGNQYRNVYTNFDVTVESGGSTFGVQQISKDYCNIGTSTKNPYDEVESNNLLDTWNSKKIKTLTIGWEAVGICYKMPDGLSQKAQDAFDLVVTSQNINYLYAAFSGFNQKEDGSALDPIHTSMYEFLTVEAMEAMTDEEKQICKDTQIIPFVRSGGNTAANSSYSFWAESQFEKHLSTDQNNAFIGGQYGSDRGVAQTDEANSKGWDLFQKVDYPGQMIYFTSAFTDSYASGEQKTRQIIKDRGYRFMSYKNKNGITYSYDYKNFNNGYDWVRPINLMFKIDDLDTKQFIAWLLNAEIEKQGTKVSNYLETLKNNGAAPLTAKEIQSMMIGTDFWVSDTALSDERSGESKKIYGAIR